MQGLLTVMLTPNKGKVMPCNTGSAALLPRCLGPLFAPLSFSLDSVQSSVSAALRCLPRAVEEPGVLQRHCRN